MPVEVLELSQYYELFLKNMFALCSRDRYLFLLLNFRIFCKLVKISRNISSDLLYLLILVQSPFQVYRRNLPKSHQPFILDFLMRFHENIFIFAVTKRSNFVCLCGHVIGTFLVFRNAWKESSISPSSVTK